MKRLDVRFEEATKMCIASIGADTDETLSSVARSAMDIGIGIIQTRLDTDGDITLKKIEMDQFLINSKA